MRRHGAGFTIIELIVTMTVMAVLMTLAIGTIRASERDARDQERKTDIDTIARGLEIYYLNGNPYSNPPNGIPKGYYPGGQQITITLGTTPPYVNFLEGVGATAYKAPQASTETSFNIDPNYTTSAAGNNADGSYDNTQARALLATRPYLYQPLTRSDVFCASYVNCVKFNLYYLTEKNDTLQVVRSKNQ